MQADTQHLKHLEVLRETGYWGRQGAGCLVFAAETRRFLVALRSAHCHHPRTYSTIGGAVDDGETPEETMRRELAEECGYSGSISEIKTLHVFSEETKAGTIFNYHNFLAVISTEFDAHSHWETEKFVWVDFQGLSKLEPKHFGLEALLKHSGDVLCLYANDDATNR